MRSLIAADARALAVNLVSAVLILRLIKDDDSGWADDGLSLAAIAASTFMVYWGWKNG